MAATTPTTPSSSRTLDFGRCLTFAFEDPDWVRKILIGGLFALLSMVLVGAFFMLGYAARLIRRSARAEGPALPEWDDLGEMFMEGLQSFVIYLAHLMAIGLALAAIFVPIFVGTKALSWGSDDLPAPLAVLAAMAALAGYAFFFLLFVAMALYLPAAYLRFATEERFGAAFEFGENFAFIRRNLVNYILALLVYLVANFVSQFGLILCCIGIFPFSFWALSVFGYALGEVARRDPAGLPAATGTSARPLTEEVD